MSERTGLGYGGTLMKSAVKLGLGVGLLLISGSAASAAPILVNLQARGDTVIRADQPNDNFGAYSRMWVGRNGGKTPTGPLRRGLLEFDLSSIPAGATITSVALTMTVADSHNVSSDFRLHRALVDWGEGTKTGKGGGTSTAGEASWNARIAGGAGWGAAGGLAGTDYQSTVSAARTIDNTGSYTWASTSALVADAQAWVSNPSSNFGWFVISSAEGTSESVTRFATREDTTTANRPSLAVEYTVPEPSGLLLLALGALSLGSRARRRQAD